MSPAEAARPPSIAESLDSLADVGRVLAPPDAGLVPKLRGLYALTKPNLSGLVMSTGVLGYVLAANGVEPVRLVHLVVGLWCTSGGAGALNMYLERGLDERMRRTRTRPIPAGVISPGAALGFAIGLFTFGFAVLSTFASPTAAMLSLLTLAIYAFVYTPLKRRGPVAIWVGAVPGAIPPMIGWAAATGTLAPPAWALFAVLFLWQFPHFLALAWMYREDYARGGFDFLARDFVVPAGRAIDVEAPIDGGPTARQMFVGASLLVPATLSLVPLGAAGLVYGFGALALGAWFVGSTLRMLREPATPAARRVFFASIIYLPLLLVLIVADRWLPLG